MKAKWLVMVVILLIFSSVVFLVFSYGNKKSNYDHFYVDEQKEKINGLVIPADVDITELSSKEYGEFVWITLKVRGVISRFPNCWAVLELNNGAIGKIEHREGNAFYNDEMLFTMVEGNTLHILFPKEILGLDKGEFRMVDIYAITFGMHWDDYVNKDIDFSPPTVDNIAVVSHENGCISCIEEKTVAYFENDHLNVTTIVFTPVPCYDLNYIDAVEYDNITNISISLTYKGEFCIGCFGYQKINYLLQPAHEIEKIEVVIKINNPGAKFYREVHQEATITR